jgi:hypothetical protein
VVITSSTYSNLSDYRESVLDLSCGEQYKHFSPSFKQRTAQLLADKLTQRWIQNRDPGKNDESHSIEWPSLAISLSRWRRGQDSNLQSDY